MRNVRLVIATAALTGAIGAPYARAQAGATDPLAAAYCITCHSEQRKTGGVVLEHLDLTDAAQARTLERVIRKLQNGTMPPPGAPHPDPAARSAAVTRIESAIDRAAERHPNPGRVPAVHRLNRAEYANAVRDLLGVEINAAALLPPDDSGYGFDNIADVLSVSPLLTERYLAAAQKISRIAVGDPAIRPATDVFTVNKYLRQDDRVSDDLPFGSRGGLAVRYYFPVDGDYIVKIFLDRTYDGRIRGLGDAHILEVRLNGERVQQLTVGTPPSEEGAARPRGARAASVDGSEVTISAKAGPGVLAVSFVKKAAEPEGMLRPQYAVTSYEYAGDVVVPPGIGSIELRGPDNIKGPGDSPSRAKIFSCRPGGGGKVRAAADAGETRCAREILTALARRAFRRPVTTADVQPLLAFYQTARKTGTFDAGIEAALRRLLVSPDFLFRIEHDPAGAAGTATYRVSDLELASRLSFFLWSSIPDDELLEVATRGQLKDPAVLERQVRRMLADQRAVSLVDNFAGQWLYLRNIRLVSPDPSVFPQFDENLRQALEREITLFLRSQFQEDHGVGDLLSADYTFVNERLARHYGIPNVYGDHFRRLVLPADIRAERTGLLGKGAVLTLTSYANRTSPVLRGKWLLDNVLGSPPPPPPPNIPALKENVEGAPATTVRQRLEQHRSNPSCASCHRIMDPLGFALENFDAIGQWRTTGEGGAGIDASGVLADGTPVDGPAALRQALLSHNDDFARTVTEKLLTYALGRGVEYYDAPAVRQIVRGARSDDYRWSALILGIVKSVPFQMRNRERGESTQ